MKAVFHLAIAGLLAACGSASADVCFGPGPAGTIPDNNPTGVSSSIVVNQNVQIASVQIMVLGLTHTFAGDLRMALSFNGGGPIAFVDRPGVPATTFGFPANYGGDYTFGNSNGLNLDLEAALAPLGDGAILPPGSYFDPGGQSLAPFGGLFSQGTWTLTISDHAGADVGGFTGWNLCVTEVPAPGAAGLLGLAGIVAARRRRR